MYHEKRRKTDEGKHHSKNPKTTNKPFSFLDYKRILEKVFFNEELVEDVNDVWLFVKKFELISMKKPIDHSNVSSLSYNPLGLPVVFDKMHLINIKMNYSDDELASRLPTYDQEESYKKRPLTKQDISKFRQLILMYMDFKQKEKFNKLKKLRETQTNLPVFQFK